MRWQSARYVIRHCAVCLCQACSHWLRSSSRAAGTQMVPGLPCVRLAWGLVVEGRNHDDSGGSEFSGCGDYVSHRAVKQGFVFGIFREDESLESGSLERGMQSMNSFASSLPVISSFPFCSSARDFDILSTSVSFRRMRPIPLRDMSRQILK